MEANATNNNNNNIVQLFGQFGSLKSRLAPVLDAINMDKLQDRIRDEEYKHASTLSLPPPPPSSSFSSSSTSSSSSISLPSSLSNVPNITNTTNTGYSYSTNSGSFGSTNVSSFSSLLPSHSVTSSSSLSSSASLTAAGVVLSPDNLSVMSTNLFSNNNVVNSRATTAPASISSGTGSNNRTTSSLLTSSSSLQNTSLLPPSNNNSNNNGFGVLSSVSAAENALFVDLQAAGIAYPQPSTTTATSSTTASITNTTTTTSGGSSNSTTTMIPPPLISYNPNPSLIVIEKSIETANRIHANTTNNTNTSTNMNPNSSTDHEEVLSRLLPPQLTQNANLFSDTLRLTTAMVLGAASTAVDRIGTVARDIPVSLTNSATTTTNTAVNGSVTLSNANPYTSSANASATNTNTISNLLSFRTSPWGLSNLLLTTPSTSSSSTAVNDLNNSSILSKNITTPGHTTRHASRFDDTAANGNGKGRLGNNNNYLEDGKGGSIPLLHFSQFSNNSMNNPNTRLSMLNPATLNNNSSANDSSSSSLTSSLTNYVRSVFSSSSSSSSSPLVASWYSSFDTIITVLSLIIGLPIALCIRFFTISFSMVLRCIGCNRMGIYVRTFGSQIITPKRIIYGGLILSVLYILWYTLLHVKTSYIVSSDETGEITGLSTDTSMGSNLRTVSKELSSKPLTVPTISPG